MKKLISFAVAGMFALSLAACGSSSSAAASSTESSAESTAASTADSAAADSDLAYLQNKGKMTIGYTVYEPMNYTDESGTFTGFDTELATAVCEKLGVEPDFVEINWDTKETELAAKSIDCIWNGLTLTDDREANMACTKPYVKNAQVVVMKADADYTSTADLAGKTVVAESGSAGETTIEEDEGLQQADFVAKSVQTDCLMEVAAGTADAAVLDLTLASAMIGEGTDYANLVIKDELNVEEYGAAFRKGSDVAAAVDTAFDELKADAVVCPAAWPFGVTWLHEPVHTAAGRGQNLCVDHPWHAVDAANHRYLPWPRSDGLCQSLGFQHQWPPAGGGGGVCHQLRLLFFRNLPRRY